MDEFYKVITNSDARPLEIAGENKDFEIKNQQKWNQILKEVDTNGDGFIDFDEF